MEKAELLSLPDQTLLAVLAHLPPRELFRCRLVCRRLRDLSLHHRIWQAVEVKDQAVLRAALRLAPCLAKIPDTIPLDILSSLVPSTACVVAELNMRVSDEMEAAQASVVLMKLSALGGVRKLHLKNYCTKGTSLSFLLNTTYNLNGLQRLEIDNFSNDPLSVAWCDVKVKPFLSKLLFFSTKVEPFLDLLLGTHAATLEKVQVLCANDKVGSLLAQVPRLRSLTCYPSYDLSQLVALPNLKNVHLMSKDEGEELFQPGTLDFLRRASHLRSVVMDFPRSGCAAHLAALAESHSASQIESLVTFSARSSQVLKLVIPMLPAYTSLQSLLLNAVPSNSFLRAISCASMPCLARLGVACSKDLCLHAWLHGPGIQDLLMRNPRLHLTDYEDSTVSLDCSCPWCKWGCHGRLRDSTRPKTYSAHSRRAGCPADCYQVVLWTGLCPLSE